MVWIKNKWNKYLKIADTLSCIKSGNAHAIAIFNLEYNNKKKKNTHTHTQKTRATDETKWKIKLKKLEKQTW